MVRLFSFFRGAAWRELSVLICVFLALNIFVFAISSYFQAPFYWYFDDIPNMLIVLSILYFAACLLWDSTLLLSGALDAFKTRMDAQPVVWNAAWRRHGISSLGLWPLLMMLMTSYTLLLSSNITLLSLSNIQHGLTHWRDAWFWQAESGIIAWFSQHLSLIPVADILYVACWPIQLFAMLWLFVRQRSPHKAMLFCASYGLLYFSGRLIGCLMPVLGPIFYKPEFYQHMNATLTHKQVVMVQKMITFAPELMQKSGLLLGGVSAMPSLHVAMVSLCAYWLWREYRWLAPLLAEWVLLTWYTTVALGWHYALDGLGAMLLTAGVVAVVRQIDGRFFTAPA